MTTSKRRIRLFLSLVALAAAGNTICSAGNWLCPPAKAQLQTAAVPAPGAQPAAESSLKNIGALVRRIRLATLDIVNDVEQRKLAVVSSDPLFLEPPAYNAKDSAVWSKEVQDLGPLEQPKKQWLDADVAHLGKWLTMLNDEFSATTFGADKKEAASATWTEMNGVLADMNNHYKVLQQLIAGPSYDNVAIGAAALKIHDDVRKLERPWKDTMKTVQSP